MRFGLWWFAVRKISCRHISWSRIWNRIWNLIVGLLRPHDYKIIHHGSPYKGWKKPQTGGLPDPFPASHRSLHQEVPNIYGGIIHHSPTLTDKQGLRRHRCWWSISIYLLLSHNARLPTVTIQSEEDILNSFRHEKLWCGLGYVPVYGPQALHLNQLNWQHS